MATTNYLLTQTQNSNGKSQIILRTYVRHDYRIRIQSGIWVSPKRWGKKNGITIPTIPGEEQEMLLQKKELLKRLTAYIEDEINKVEDKNAIDKIWGEKKVRTFYKPSKAPERTRKIFFRCYRHLPFIAQAVRAAVKEFQGVNPLPASLRIIQEEGRKPGIFTHARQFVAGTTAADRGLSNR